MRVRIVTVGRAGRLFSDLTTEYEGRARRYWSLDIGEVREERARRGLSAEEVRGREPRRLTEKVRSGYEVIALSRLGRSWSSVELAHYLERLAIDRRPGAAFLIGGALGLSGELLGMADHHTSLSTLTLPHELEIGRAHV